MIQTTLISTSNEIIIAVGPPFSGIRQIYENEYKKSHKRVSIQEWMKTNPLITGDEIMDKVFDLIKVRNIHKLTVDKENILG